MSSSQQKQRRKAEVARIQEEGAQAYRNGRHIQTVPREYLGTMDRYVWQEGYSDAAREDSQYEDNDNDQDNIDHDDDDAEDDVRRPTLSPN